MDLDTLESNQYESKTDSLEESIESTQHISDILVTQIILCIAIVTGIFILNIFKPDISTYIIDNFKYHSSVEFSETIKTILVWFYDRV